MPVLSFYTEVNEGEAIIADLNAVLENPIIGLNRIRVIKRFFIEASNLEASNIEKTNIKIDADYTLLDDLNITGRTFAVESLPGQFDQEAYICAQCIAMELLSEPPIVRFAKIYELEGDISNDDFEIIKNWIINPVESRESSLDVPKTLVVDYGLAEDGLAEEVTEEVAIAREVAIVDGFISLDDEGLKAKIKELNLAMDLADLSFCQGYFKDKEGRDPTITEIRMIDTYWSDHCRHTTFLTVIDHVEIDDEVIQKSYDRYLGLREALQKKDTPITFMDMATIGARALKAKGILTEMDESEEVNAACVKIQADVKGKLENWLLYFKNETHNHPTEMEPFGGAATCLGGGIRDPLSGRSYVHQAMRITGAGDPRTTLKNTLPGKLTQRKICRTAADGYSSYGNQVGVPSGHVFEIYHPGYVAKRMELGALVAAAPESNVVRSEPVAGDVVILLGGKTGRDGIGGATGSSKVQQANALETSGAEVQKGDAPEERKIIRLFRNPEATTLIKCCNDFGAGGISVAVGELADGLDINLNSVPAKYGGLDGTDLAISESQERMAVVVAQKNAAKFIELADAENLDATIVAVVTDKQRVNMTWNGKTVVSLARDFLNSNGVQKHATIKIEAPVPLPLPQNEEYLTLNENEMSALLSDLSFCSQKGLVQQFDHSVGAGTVLAPLGGMRQLSPVQVMAAKLPVLEGDTNTCSLMSWAYDPFVSEKNPYYGAMAAVVHSVAKIIAAGGSRKKCWLTFQEYFESLGDSPVRWGKPAAALLGALDAQMGLECAALGGKDSMSGSFEGYIDVPPTLISFAVSVAEITNIISTEFKGVGNKVYYLCSQSESQSEISDFDTLRSFFDKIESLISSGKVKSAWAVGAGGIAEAVAKMSFGNGIGLEAVKPLTKKPGFGGFVIEVEEASSDSEGCLGDCLLDNCLLDNYLDDCLEVCLEDCLLGTTTKEYTIKYTIQSTNQSTIQSTNQSTNQSINQSTNQSTTTPNGIDINMKNVQDAWEHTLSDIYPARAKHEDYPAISHCISCYKEKSPIIFGGSVASPTFVMPLFPGTNSEYDMQKAITAAGGQADIIVIRNRSKEDIAESIQILEKALSSAHGLVLPGGDVSANYIVSLFRDPRLRTALDDLVDKRDGLVCGIGGGFRALTKLGLLPGSLTGNHIGRHQSILARVRIISDKSPWFKGCVVGHEAGHEAGFKVGYEAIVPVSSTYGRFAADESVICSMVENGQITTQYIDGLNPFGSAHSIEGVTSADGRILGRMGHAERSYNELFVNIPGNKEMNIFEGAVRYFSG